MGNESTAKTELEKSIIGKYYLDGRKFNIPVDTNKMCECSLNTLLDSYGTQLPQCIILIGCRTLTRTNKNALRILVASNKTFMGTKLNRHSTVNYLSSDEQCSNAPMYRQASADLHNKQYSSLNNNNNVRFINNQNRYNIANIRKSIANNNNNNNNNLNEVEYRTFRNIYLKKHPRTTKNIIMKEYKKYMKKRLSFAMKNNFK